MISKEEFTTLHSEIATYIKRTPIMRSRLLNGLAETEVYFKCENFQRMGAFKMRGATAAILALSAEERAKGVVTHSSGNFAQAVSLSAKSLGIPAYIVMPSSAPQVKKDAVKTYGGQITECEPTIKAREAAAAKIEEETGATFLHPSNDLNVIYGQGTAAKEFLEDFPELDVIITPVGGGGLLAGTALAVDFYAEKCKTIGAEPFEVDDAYRSLESGKIEFNKTTNTIADGLKTNLGDKNFPIIKDKVSEIIRVEEEEIITAMKLIWERMKIVVEPSAAVAFAAVLREKEKFHGKRVGIIISGGNVDLSNLPF
ncbi:pyridoxal-phosphate dependent enzyme [Salegentibacter mishustinae]|uniref:Serine dehydratase n=1 Tax=Salegentibacter mishustinae TaxID=270918 RepID=A0A0Q9ZCB5_9FLAO|nr:pyridoxal-phosphate dependent enzyme [Salegentibacter mishustinae]KRG30717.1 serine dehydratase [Salegentibacter mishustinae]PNW23606.1 serine dehydratase [Salegentibacter mishustinae]PZX66691.1 threonine dehydratase [Salegentibacter mishustinae]GGW83974.1 serine/threonine dehydratase [Salegentibacter mishustinae]